MIKLKDTNYFQNLTVVFNREGADPTLDHVEMIFKGVFEATSDILRGSKSNKDDKPVAVVIDDAKGNMIAAGVVEYNKNETEGQDNFNYYWTVDPKDVEDAVQYKASQSIVQEQYAKRMKEGYGFVPHPRLIGMMMSLPVEVLVDLLKANAKEGEEFVVEYEGYFKAASAVENKEIVISITPDGAMKTLIKDDAAVQA